MNNSNEPTTIFIQTPCKNPKCPAPEFEIGFGLAGGGYGVYEYCEVCESIVSKTQVSDDEC